jgi:hypothetical protein
MSGEESTNTSERGLYDSLKEWIMKHGKVTEASHRFGGTEFQVEGFEFMHSHGRSFLDIRLSKEDQEKALGEKLALPHRFAPQAGWVSVRLATVKDLENAKTLIQLAYENARKEMEGHVSTRKQLKLD